MGQRSQIYVRYEGKLIIANYYQWNYGERMISRARQGIEWIKDYIDHGYSFAFESPNYIKRLSRILDANFDMRDVAISCDLFDEYNSYNLGCDFNEQTFNRQDNNDGQLFIDISGGKIYYCLRFPNDETAYAMSARQYMYQYSKDGLDDDALKALADNLKYIDANAALMDDFRLADFIVRKYR